MSSKRFLQLTKSAYQNGDINAMRDAYYDYQDTHCLYPKRQLIYDSHLGSYRFIEVSCGHCYHCQKSKVNEWCTRMYAHVEDFKHVYYVTLTYRSITNPDLPINQLYLNKMVQAVWSKDALNSTRHLSYNPCVLVKKHYQDFFKRLRKNTGFSDITYVLSGEYGEDYGRPHFHIILFSNSVLTRKDIERAWSFMIFKHADGRFFYYKNQKNGTIYNMPIGHVDFHDLVSNGTFNTKCKIKVEGTFMNAAHCFSYVCKYVVKRDDANLSRVHLAYNNLYKKYSIPNTLGKSQYEILFYNRSLHFTPEQILQLNQLKLNPYEKILYQPGKTIYAHGLCRSRASKINGIEFRQILLPESYQDFCNLHLPFCEFSRATPIGSVYAARHIQEFTQGVYNKPLLQTDGFVVPSYFRLKAQERVFGLRKMRKGIKSNSFNIGNLLDLYRRFSESYSADVPLREYFGDSPSAQIIDELLQDSRWHFLDKATGERVIFFNDHAQMYKFQRKGRRFKFTGALPLRDWLRINIEKLQTEFNAYESRLRISQENMHFAEAAKLMLLDMGDDEVSLKHRYSIRVDAIRKQKQLEYNQTHLFVE